MQTPQAIGVCRNLKDGPRVEALADQPCDERQEDTLMFGVERQVDEDVCGGEVMSRLRHGRVVYRAAFFDW